MNTSIADNLQTSVEILSIARRMAERGITSANVFGCAVAQDRSEKEPPPPGSEITLVMAETLFLAREILHRLETSSALHATN